MPEHSQIAVLGAGLMGHGIGLTFARAGHPVTLYDPDASMRESAHQRVSESMLSLGHTESEIDNAIEKISVCDSLPQCVRKAAFVFEAAPEKLELKQSIFAQIFEHTGDSAIVASNTSVIQISKIVDGLEQRERALGTHWWNPPHQIPLVEVIKTEWTSTAVADSMQTLLTNAGKHAVMVEKDVPGFIGNRLQHALWREAISLVENGICTAEAVDDVVKSSFGRRLAVLGPLENADLVGIELTQDIHRQVLFDLDSQTAPSAYLQNLIDEGKTGMSANAGFRQWAPDDLTKTKKRIAEHLVKLESILPD